jgi:two-component system, OmpR family, KDP operon response regulator KdpE
MCPTILVVDDEAPMRKFIASNLRVRGYNVVTAADGIEALKVAAGQPLDLVLLDICMPGQDGTQVLATLRRNSQVPVIVVSGRARKNDRLTALKLGATDFLSKPFSVDELLTSVQAALQRAGGSEPHAPLLLSAPGASGHCVT